MNDDKLDNLFRSVRQAPPDTTRAEFGFETRLLARLRAEAEPGAVWLAWLRRLAPVFAAIVLGLGVWNFIALNSASTDLQSAIGTEHDSVALVTPFDGQ